MAHAVDVAGCPVEHLAGALHLARHGQGRASQNVHSRKVPSSPASPSTPCAMMNAVELGQALDRYDVETALDVCEARERPVTDRLQRYSRLYGRIGTAWPRRPGSQRRR